MSDKHDERARVLLDCELYTHDNAECMVVLTPRLLAEQFREVEREADHIALDFVNAQLREVVRAGDALRTCAMTEDKDLVIHDLDLAINAWDAATKGIARD